MAKAKPKRKRVSDCRKKECPGKYVLSHDEGAPVFECNKCQDQDLTWHKFYNDYLQLYSIKSNWDNKKDQVSCIIGFFCYLYEKRYGTKYIFVPKNRNPYGSKECKDSWTLLTAFNGNAHEVRRYLYWLFKKGLSRGAQITSFGYINTPALIRKYNLYAKKKHIRTRASKLPNKFIEWCRENTAQIFDNYELGTMNDLGAILSYSQHYGSDEIITSVLDQAESQGLIKANRLNVGE